MLRSINEDQVIRRIQDDNPWWALGSIESDFRSMPRRLYFDLLYPLVERNDLKRAVVLMGPRRVGKTVLIRHLIQALLDKGVSPRKICYLSIDAPIYNRIPLEELFALSRAAVHDDNPEGFYLFFDEVQYLKDWEVHLKSMVDAFRHSRFLASGSAAAALRLKSNESGAGRFTDFMLPPLTFHEFLHLRGLDNRVFPVEGTWNGKPVEWVTTADLAELNQLFIHYINLGGYPEIVMNESLQQNPGRFIKSDIVDKVLLRDLPSLYGISDVQELNSLFNTVAFNTGKEFTLDSLSHSSHVQKATIKKYLEYLEAAYLIRIVERVDANARRFQRTPSFKIYLTNPSIRRALFSPVGESDPEIGELVETAIFAQWAHRPKQVFYASWKVNRQEGEVDIVGLNARLLPAFAVEIKWSDRYFEKPAELKSLLTFLETNKLKEAMVTTISQTGQKEIQGKTIHFFPAALYAYLVGQNTLKAQSEHWMGFISESF